LAVGTPVSGTQIENCERNLMGNSNLETGLAALKQGDYPTAIATLETICDEELHESTRLRAQMGLVQAYQRMGDRSQATKLCESLIQSKNAQAKKWAMAKLRELRPSKPSSGQLKNTDGQKLPTLPNSPAVPGNDPTGFMPFDSPVNSSANSPANSSNPSPTADPTGFMPFSPSPQPPKTPQPPATGQNQPPQHQPPQGKNIGAKLSPSVKRPPPPPPPKTPLPKRTGQQLPNVGRPPKPPIPPNVKLSPNSASVPVPPAPPIPQRPTVEPEISDRPTSAASPTPPPSPEITWRQAGRAKKNWRKMKPTGQGQLFLAQITTAVALFWMVREFVEFSLLKINEALYQMPLVHPVQGFYREQTWNVLIGLILLLGASPWLMDLLLEKVYGLKALSWKTLADRSPEATKLLLRFSRQQNIPQCQLGLLPTDAPIAISYGFLPRFARIVISQGLLEQLEADEIAAIYAGQLGQIANGTLSLMSLAMLLLQIPYIIYLQVAKDGKPWENVHTSQGQFMVICATLISSVGYSLYWLLRWPVLWLSRLRLYHSDRLAAELTGNPNGLCRALLKIAIGMAENIQTQGETNGLLEGFDLFMPVGVRQAVSLGSCAGQTAWSDLLEWDRRNPWRRWMTLNNSHLPMGDRLYILSLYAKFWQLEPELDFVATPKRKLEKQEIQKFILQVIPFFGLPIGLALGLGFWGIGAIGQVFGWEEITWLAGDRTVLLSCLPIGISMAILLRINHFFPDIIPSSTSSCPWLSEMLTNPTSLPIDSQPISLEGTLMGRSGISNAFGQDLILRSPTGLIKLHCFSKLGPFAYLWPLQNRPIDLVGHPVKITGWFRRGATVWVDVETVESTNNRKAQRLSFQCGHPIWSTILAAVCALWGIYLNFQGGISY
jgi:Zn-dependent protease with chaperone function